MSAPGSRGQRAAHRDGCPGRETSLRLLLDVLPQFELELLRVPLAVVALDQERAGSLAPTLAGVRSLEVAHHPTGHQDRGARLHTRVKPRELLVLSRVTAQGLFDGEHAGFPQLVHSLSRDAVILQRIHRDLLPRAVVRAQLGVQSVQLRSIRVPGSGGGRRGGLLIRLHHPRKIHRLRHESVDRVSLNPERPLLGLAARARARALELLFLAREERLRPRGRIVLLVPVVRVG